MGGRGEGERELLFVVEGVTAGGKTLQDDKLSESIKNSREKNGTQLGIEPMTFCTLHVHVLTTELLEPLGRGAVGKLYMYIHVDH